MNEEKFKEFLRQQTKFSAQEYQVCTKFERQLILGKLQMLNIIADYLDIETQPSLGIHIVEDSVPVKKVVKPVNDEEAAFLESLQDDEFA